MNQKKVWNQKLTKVWLLYLKDNLQKTKFHLACNVPVRYLGVRFKVGK